MAYSKLKTLAKGCTISLLAKDIQSDKKHIRIFLTNSENAQATVKCEEHISDKLRKGMITVAQLMEFRYNPNTQMIQ